MQKLPRGYVKACIEIQILRITEGGQHTAQVCRESLHNKRKRKILLLTRCAENEVTERQEG